MLLNGYGVKCKYNELNQKNEISNCPGVTYDNLVCNIQSVCSLNNYKITKDTLYSHIDTISRENAFHPIRDWVCAEKWDRTSRVNNLIKSIAAKDNDIKALYIKKWLHQAIAAIFDKHNMPYELVLVLAGRQGLGKTTWFRNLVPQEVEENAVKDGLLINTSNKDDHVRATTCWIGEMGSWMVPLRNLILSHLKALFHLKWMR